MLATLPERPALRRVADRDHNKLPAQPQGRTEPLPRPGVPVWVECGGTRIAAYLDAAGVWRSFARGQELKPPVKMLDVILWSQRRPVGLRCPMPYALTSL